MDEARVHGVRAEIVDLLVPVEELTFFQGNARRGNVAAICDSLRVHGQYKPVTVRAQTGEVLVGNHTLKAAMELGWTHVAATYVDCTDEQAERIVVVDNRSQEVGSMDRAALAELLKECGQDAGGTGYSDDEAAALIGSMQATDLDDLLAEVGEPTPEDLLRRVSLRVPPRLLSAWRSHVDTYSGDHVQALAVLLGLDFDGTATA